MINHQITFYFSFLNRSLIHLRTFQVISALKLWKILKRNCKTPRCNYAVFNFTLRGTILTTKLLLRKISNYHILKAKAPTAKPFADIFSIEESFHILESRPYLTSHVITTGKTLKLKRHIVLDKKISIKSNRTTICVM